MRLRFVFSIGAAAAAAAMFVLLAQPMPPPPAPVKTAVEPPPPALSEALATYRQAGAQLLEARKARRADIPDAVWRDLETSLTDIDTQLERIEVELAKAPTAARLIGFAFAAHQKRVAVLSKLVQTFSHS